MRMSAQRISQRSRYAFASTMLSNLFPLRGVSWLCPVPLSTVPSRSGGRPRTGDAEVRKQFPEDVVQYRVVEPRLDDVRPEVVASPSLRKARSRNSAQIRVENFQTMNDPVHRARRIGTPKNRLLQSRLGQPWRRAPWNSTCLGTLVHGHVRGCRQGRSSREARKPLVGRLVRVRPWGCPQSPDPASVQWAGIWGPAVRFLIGPAVHLRGHAQCDQP